MRAWWRILAVLIGSAFAPAASAETATIAVAANFAEVAEHLADDVQDATGHQIRISLGATGALYAQIVNGAPYHAFLAADQARPKRLEAEGRAVAGSRFTYAVGRLVLWSADPDLIGPEWRAVLESGAFRRLALANAAVAPYGLAASQTLRALGLADRLSPKIVLGETVAQAYAHVATGNAELGLVALSQIKSRRRRASGSHWPVPESLHDPVRQDAVLLLRGAENAAAKAFLAHLRGEGARAVMADLGYGAD
ncbi:MAG: molybdate ABC transporter substrate-binding protein [Pseudomonadota bacterium]